MRIRYLAAAILVVLALPAYARAQGYVAPGIGVVFGNPSAQGRADFVADIGWVPRFEPIGVELDVMFAPSFFGNEGPYGQNGVTTVMGNVVIAGGEGGRRGFGRRGGASVRPYLSGGIGVMHETVTAPATAVELTNNDLGVNVGAGFMALSRRSIGVRADVRYFRDLVGGQTGNVDFGSFHFWRAGIGFNLGF